MSTESNLSDFIGDLDEGAVDSVLTKLAKQLGKGPGIDLGWLVFGKDLRFRASEFNYLRKQLPTQIPQCKVDILLQQN